MVLSLNITVCRQHSRLLSPLCPAWLWVSLRDQQSAKRSLLSFTEYSKSVFKCFVDSARAGDVSSALCFTQSKVTELLKWMLVWSQICCFSGWYTSTSVYNDMWYRYLSLSEMGCKEILLHTQSCIFSYLDFRILFQALCFQPAEKEKTLEV